MKGAKGGGGVGDIEFLGEIAGDPTINIRLFKFCNTGEGVGDCSGDFLAVDTLFFLFSIRIESIGFLKIYYLRVLGTGILSRREGIRSCAEADGVDKLPRACVYKER